MIHVLSNALTARLRFPTVSKIVTKHSELRKVLFFALWFLLLFVWIIGGTAERRRIHRKDVFDPSLGRLWRSR